VLFAIGCVVVWLGIVLWTRLRSPRTPSVGGDGGPVPEAIRVLLRPDTRRDDPSILNAAILELAETGVLAIAPADSQHPAMVEPGALPHSSRLPEYQASVVARLLHRRGTSLAPVPLTALQPGEDPTATRWHRDFYRQVRRAAAEHGLLQPAVGQSGFVLLLLASLVTNVLAANALSKYWHGQQGLTDLQFLVLEAIDVAVLVWAARIRPTAAGRALIAGNAVPATPAVTGPLVPAPDPGPDPTLVLRPGPGEGEGQGADQGAPPPPSAPNVKVLPNQLEPLPKRQIWSSYGGDWHPLDIRAKETYSVRGGNSVVLIPIFFGIICVIGAFATKRNGSTPTTDLTFVLFAALPVLVLIGVLISTLSRRRLPRRAVLRGQVAKLWEVARTKDEGSSERYYYCALDVGRAPESVRLKVGVSLYRRLRVGTEIEVLVNPRRRSIKDVRFVAGLAGE
jgi:hypothetical protein